MSNIIKEIDRMSGAEVPSHTITDALKKLGAGPSKNITDALSRVEVGGSVNAIMQIMAFEDGTRKQASIVKPYIDVNASTEFVINATYAIPYSPDTGEWSLEISGIEAMAYSNYTHVAIESGALADSLRNIMTKYLTLERAMTVTSNPNQGLMLIPITEPIDWDAIADLFDAGGR